MNSAYLVAVIGAVAGLVTGLGSALIALRVATSQDASARELQRRQWRADTLRDCYSQVGGTHRRFMLAWLGWWDEYNADRKREQYAGRGQANPNSVPPSSPPAQAPAESAGTGRKMSDLLQAPVAVLSLGAAFLALKWQVFQVASILTLIVAGTALWYQRKQGHPWRDKKVATTGSLCVVAAVVLATTFWTTNTRPPSASPRASANGSPVQPKSQNSSPAPMHGTPPTAGSVVLATAPNSPAKIEAMTRLKQPTGDSWVTAKTLRFTSKQLAQINQVSRGVYPLPATLDPVPLEEAVSDITFVGNANEVVTINGIAITRHCSALLSGTLFSSPAQGFNNTIRIGFNLDDPQPVARYIPEGAVNARTNFFPGHDVTLAPGEAQTFEFDVTSQHHYCEFTFRISVVTPNGPITEIINDFGKPFALTGPAQSAYGAMYAGGTAALNDRLNKTGYWAPEKPTKLQN